MNAWALLSEARTTTLWNRFDEQFTFRPSVNGEDCPSIREPQPSCTYDISRVYDSAAQYDMLESDLNGKMLAAFRRCVPQTGRFYVLDRQHQCNSFCLHASSDADDPNACLVPVLPNGDNYIFLAMDFNFELFGHPSERTKCAFGHNLLHAVDEVKPLIFNKVVRIDGQPCNGTADNSGLYSPDTP